MSDMYRYVCVTTCFHKDMVWNPGQIFETSDPADIPPHHFEGGINPKNTAAVEALINERLGVVEQAPEETPEPTEPAQAAQPTGRGRRG